MKELIDSELAKHKNIINSYDGIDDNEFSRIEKMIFDEIEKDHFSTVMHHFLELSKKIGLENDWQQKQSWEHTSDFAANHILETIEFIKTVCSAEEFSTIAVSLAEDIAEKSKSKEFIEALRETAKKFPEECEKYNIYDDIDSAEGYL